MCASTSNIPGKMSWARVFTVSSTSETTDGSVPVCCPRHQVSSRPRQYIVTRLISCWNCSYCVCLLIVTAPLLNTIASSVFLHRLISVQQQYYFHGTLWFCIFSGGFFFFLSRFVTVRSSAATHTVVYPALDSSGLGLILG